MSPLTWISAGTLYRSCPLHRHFYISSSSPFPSSPLPIPHISQLLRFSTFAVSLATAESANDCLRRRRHEKHDLLRLVSLSCSRAPKHIRRHPRLTFRSPLSLSFHTSSFPPTSCPPPIVIGLLHFSNLSVAYSDPRSCTASTLAGSCTRTLPFPEFFAPCILPPDPFLYSRLD